MISLIVYISSSQLQRSLARQIFTNDSRMTIQAINRIYEPILNTYKVSSLWVLLGQIDSLGDPDSYKDKLEFLVRNENMVSSMSLRGQQRYRAECGTPGGWRCGCFCNRQRFT